eukprot:14755707-Alexandrium_andersonii.AAC.1
MSLGVRSLTPLLPAVRAAAKSPWRRQLQLRKLPNQRRQHRMASRCFRGGAEHDMRPLGGLTASSMRGTLPLGG